MLEQGFELMMIGMGTVFAFLLLMVGSMKVSARVIRDVFPPPPEPVRIPRPTASAGAEIAVVLAAARRFQEEQGAN